MIRKGYPARKLLALPTFKNCQSALQSKDQGSSQRHLPGSRHDWRLHVLMANPGGCQLELGFKQPPRDRSAHLADPNKSKPVVFLRD